MTVTLTTTALSAFGALNDASALSPLVNVTVGPAIWVQAMSPPLGPSTVAFTFTVAPLSTSWLGLRTTVKGGAWVAVMVMSLDTVESDAVAVARSTTVAVPITPTGRT